MGSRNDALVFTPVRHFHPGETLREKLNEMEMSVKELSVRTGETEQALLEVLDCRSAINARLALRLEYVTSVPADFWLRKQSNYDLYVAQNSGLFVGDSIKRWLDSFPLSEMVKHGWLKDSQTTEEMAESVLHFFGVVSPEAWENYYFKQKLKVAFRISLAGTVNPYALSAWLRKGELQAQEIHVDATFNRKKLKETIPDIVCILNYPDKDFIPRLRDALAGLGIKLIFTKSLRGVPVKGASRWVYGSPCIQLLQETEMYDNFCYTVLHELGHICLHGKKDVFLENAGFAPEDPEYTRKESEADIFARNYMSTPTGNL